MFGQETEIKVVWPYLKVFRFSKDKSAGQSAREKIVDRRGFGNTILMGGQGWTLLAQLITGLGGKGLL